MKKIFTTLISILLLPFTILIFLLPVLVYFLPLMNIDFINIVGSLIITLWALVFLSSIVFLSSYCGFLCPITKVFNFIAYSTKNNNILTHRFPKIVGTIVQILWLSGIFYVFIRFLGNVFEFLPKEPVFSNVRLQVLISFYLLSAILLKTEMGRDELGHYMCPITTFIKAGIVLNKILKLPGFRIVPYPNLCRSCSSCNKVCSYQNNVMAMVQSNEINYKVCSNCGKCINSCKYSAIRREWTT